MGSKLSLLLAICIPLQGFIFSAKKINRSWFRGHVVRHGRIPGRFSAVHGAHGREDGGVTSEDSKKRVEFQLSRGADAILEALGRIDEKTSRFQSKTGNVGRAGVIFWGWDGIAVRQSVKVRVRCT
eukprot:1363658-Amorphochlora_amoeboformis.AAC.1